MDAAAHPSVPQRLVEGLNEPQRQAVETLSGPLLVVAGPGSGKTRVLTHRIGALLASGVPAREILAVTFTNKAAAEMRNRLAGLVGEDALRGMWVATFHSACVKLLRIEHEAAGIPRDFSILDDRDTLAVLKEQAAAKGLIYEPAELKTAASQIGFAKNHGEGPEAAAARYRDAGLGTLMAAYEKKLAQMGALDFDDLLLRAWKVLRDDEEVRSRWQRRFSHVLVDEYQDTNAVQFSIVRAIAAGTRNICVVGDLDQCHPAGTMVMTPSGQVPIEALDPDTGRVATWRPGNRVRGNDLFGMPTTNGRGTRWAERGYRFSRGERHYEGDLLALSADGHTTEVTPNHRVYVRWRSEVWEDRDQTIVYLMRKGGWWRIGTCFLHRSSSATFGLSFRGRQEGADAAWVLAVLPSRDARVLEAVLAANFGLPMATFVVPASGKSGPRSEADIDAIFSSVEDMGKKAAKLLTEYGRDLRFPFWKRDRVAKGGSRYSKLIEACNVMDRLMEVPVADGSKVRYEMVNVTRRHFSGSVYSLDVEPFHNYVADGIVVGNSIYSWRGSSPEIMAGFTAEYPEAKVVVLEENYRSTKAILAVAQAVIDANPAPWRARLHTGNAEGAPARLYVADDDRDEASFIVDEIQATGEPLDRHAVLVRTNAQTRVLEEELNRRGLPYAVVGALRFYDRAEIKDALAYLRLAMNPADTASFLRCANTPRRGLGPAALDAVAALADAQGIAVLDAARACGGGAGGVTKRAAESLAGFVELVDAVAEAAEDGPQAAIEACAVRTGLREAVGRAADGVGRVENLDELRSAAARFEGGPVPTSPEILDVAELDGREATRAFLENVTLVSSEDLAGDGTGSVEKVQILTAHSAKGKEFGHVFVAGLEQNLFPHSRSIGNDAEMAEERRLLFVACSRAEETLTLTRCAQRMLYGNKLSFNEPSVFLSDIDHLLVEVASRRGRTRWRDPHSPRRAHPAGVRPGGQGRSAGAVAARRAGADHALLAPRTAPLEPVAPRGGPRLGAEQLVVGQRVRHATFGVGVVESVDAVRKMARISFGAVRKDLMLEYAPLEQV